MGPDVVLDPSALPLVMPENDRDLELLAQSGPDHSVNRASQAGLAGRGEAVHLFETLSDSALQDA
jgi:hypothetical protein